MLTSPPTTFFCLLVLKCVNMYDYRCGYFHGNIQFPHSGATHRTHRFPIIFFIAGQMKTEVAAAFDIVDNVAAF